MGDDDQTPPEVTIEPADNGFVVRHYQRGGKKDEGGRTIRRVAATEDEALGHARTASGGRVPKKKAVRSDDAVSPAPAKGMRHSRRRPVRSRRRA